MRNELKYMLMPISLAFGKGLGRILGRKEREVVTRENIPFAMRRS
jgi:hypothetical protein